MTFSSGDVLESRGDEEPSESLPWNIIALMRPVQQRWLWPRFSLFFPLMVFPSELFAVMHVFLLAGLFMTQYISTLWWCCSRQHGVSPLSCVWVICLISLAVIENWRLMLLIWPFCIKGIHIQIILNKTPESSAVWALHGWRNRWTDAWNVSYPCWDL